MRTLPSAMALLAATALVVGCTGGQSGTETPTPEAGKGGSAGSPIMTLQGGGGGAGSGPAEAGSGGIMMAGAPSGRDGSDTGGAGAGGAGSGARPSGTGGKSGVNGFAPQTGEDSEVCACALAGKAALLRARLMTLDECALRAEVEEVLAVPPGFNATIAAGDDIDARRWRGCGDVPDLAAGDAALIVYVPPASGTVGDALVASWSDPLVFGQVALGQPIALPRSDQDKLLEPTTCVAGFAAAAKGTVSNACP